MALVSSMTIATAAWSQHDPYTGPVWTDKAKSAYDTSSVWYAFKNGSITGHFRQFSMATINRKEYPDYYAIAVGGGIRYQTARFHGFQFTLSGFFIYNLASSDLGKADPMTGARNRYEIGLFDVQDPENFHNLHRLEELSLSWKRKNFSVAFGKQMLNTPFINPQDGRMRPSVASGLWMHYQPGKWKLEGGWLNHMSPRSTVKWFPVAQSMGIYAQGNNTDGSKANYAENLDTKGIGYMSGTYQPGKQWSFQLLNQYVENIFNTAMLQVNYQHPYGNGHLLAAAQYIRQDAINDGGNSDPAKTYFSPDQHSNIFSGRLGWNNKVWQTSLNYTRITKSGRFLMPREWGRDPLFTFMQRERNEGLGDVNAYMAKVTRQLAQNRLMVNVAIGRFDLPAVNNYALNKYGMPSYGQANLGATYQFAGMLKGLQAELLYVYKWHRGEEDAEAKFVVNKTDMSNINLIFNFQF
jgi:hypothetical protein